MHWKDDLVSIPLSLHVYWGSAECVVGQAWIILWAKSDRWEYRPHSAYDVFDRTRLRRLFLTIMCIEDKW